MVIVFLCVCLPRLYHLLGVVEVAEIAANVNGDKYLISWRNVQIHCEEKKKEKRQLQYRTQSIIPNTFFLKVHRGFPKF